MSAAAIIKALWPGMRRILIAIGRWVVGMVRRRGGQLVAHYMVGRVELFRERKAAAAKRGNARRVKWLAGRIRRWQAAARWLLEHATQLNKTAAAALERLALDERIPVSSPLEKAP